MNEEQKKELKTNQINSGDKNPLHSDYLKWAIVGLIAIVVAFLILMV